MSAPEWTPGEPLIIGDLALHLSRAGRAWMVTLAADSGVHLATSTESPDPAALADAQVECLQAAGGILRGRAAATEAALAQILGEILARTPSICASCVDGHLSCSRLAPPVLSCIEYSRGVPR